MSFYLAVDRNGDENVFTEKPKRFQITSLYSFTRFLWGTSNSKLEHDEFTDSGKFKLPKGFIKRLIGKELTWVDDSVEFKTINMENNQITIDVPNGMMIDVKNSDLSKGIIKFKSEYLTIFGVNKALLDKGLVCYSDTVNMKAKYYPYMLALANLMDIVQYYNSNWISKGINYYIAYDASTKNYIVGSREWAAPSRIAFICKDDALKVINNPNFRNILDVIYQNN